MIRLEHVYQLAGAIFAAIALLSVFDGKNPKRFGNAAFWGLVAFSFLAGSKIGNMANGALALALVAVGGFRFMGGGGAQSTSTDQRRASAVRRGNFLFVPALLIPITALLGTLLLKNFQFHGAPLLEAKQVTLISLAGGVILALLLSMIWLRPSPLAPIQEARRLVDTIGWAAILPQMLASLGAVFALAGVGKAVGAVSTQFFPLDAPFQAVLAYCAGMALFTAIMGNAFAAFPVMTAAIGLPLIVTKFGGDPIIMSAIGMLSGFCGTLTTPMAANFNVVPAALLELKDRDAVIKVQLPTAVMLFAVNVFLMYFFVFRFH